MSKNHAERHAKWLAKQENNMSAPENNTANPETVTINAEATKPKAKTITTESDTVSPKKEETKRGVFDLVLAGPKLVYDKAIIPAWNFVKGSVLKVKDKIVARYESEMALMKELGAAQYVLDRTGKIGIALLKIGATVTFAYFLSVYCMSNFGFSLFAPTTLLIIGIVALLAIIAKSVMAQRDAGGKVSAHVIGENIVEAVMAA